MSAAMDDINRRSTLIGKQRDPKGSVLGGKIMLIAVVILFFVVGLILALHLYARCYRFHARRRQLLRLRRRLNRSRRPNIVFYVDGNRVSDPANSGLEPAVLNSLPVFVYSSRTHPEALDCAVCLSEFEEKEKGRLLPKCNHSFHIECIDMWFHSHSTCPLCRAPVEAVLQPEQNKSHVVDAMMGEPEGRRIEPGSSSGLCAECQHEDGGSSTMSLGARRKGLDFTEVRIEVPTRNEFETELALSSPASLGHRSPGTRLLSLRRILRMGRKTPTGSSTTAFEEDASCIVAPSDIDLERGATVLTQAPTPRREMKFTQTLSPPQAITAKVGNCEDIRRPGSENSQRGIIF